MYKVLRIAAAVAALALIVYGLFQPIEEDGRWLICLWAVAPLLGVIIWLSPKTMPRGLGRSVYNLGIVIGIGFVLLSLQLLRQQVVQAQTIYTRVVVDPTSGQITSNVRPVLASQRTLRGKVFDRTGLLLVNSELIDGFARRIYPLADSFNPAAFSNIVGFFSIRFGQSGLEATFSDYLSGERGSAFNRLQNDLLGQEQVGNDLHLTLDARLQAQVSALLGDRSGSVVVLDPKTGAVLALVSEPGFDPAQLSFNPSAEDWQAENARISAYWEYLNSDAAGQPLLNRATQGQYPPGSTFKTLTAASALENAGVAEPDSIRCFNQLNVEAGAPPVINAVEGLAGSTGDPSNLERVYAYSCNVAFAQYALRLGPDRLEETARKFDIFSPADAPSQYRGFADLVTTASKLYVQPGFLNRAAALADTGYGQGQLLVTPLQMAMVAATIANDGIMMQPYLVQRVTRPDGGEAFNRSPRPIRRVMSAANAAKMQDNMRAVAIYGFGRIVSDYVPGVAVGGKSGTAQHVPDLPPHAWFIAIAPIEQPRFAVCVMIEQGGEGSGAAAQLAGQVLQAALATVQP